MSLQPQQLIVCALFFVACISQQCQYAQKGLFFSYKALSKRDTMGNMFNQINSKIQRFNESYSEKSTQYLIRNMHPQMYYNEHYQVQKFVDSKTVQVMLGDIQFAFKMDYTVEFNDERGNKTGFARGRVLMDQDKKFRKKLLINEGLLQWDPQQVEELTASYQLTIDHSVPQLTDEQKRVYEFIVNDNIKDGNLKSSIVKSFNQHYRQILKEHLNSEDLASDTTIAYKYHNVNIEYTHTWRSFLLTDSQQKGLKIDYTFQIEGHTQQCYKNNITYDQEQSGIQEVIALAQLSNTFTYALEEGLANVRVDKQWEVPEFQFYMGDLGNTFPAAYAYPSTDQFAVDCEWDKNVSAVAFHKHTLSDIRADFGIVCKAKHKQEDLFKFEMNLFFYVRLIPEEDQLTALIILVGTQQVPEFTAIDQNFKTLDKNLAEYSIRQVLSGMINQQTLGTGWKTYKRKFPGLRLKEDVLIVYDASQK